MTRTMVVIVSCFHVHGSKVPLTAFTSCPTNFASIQPPVPFYILHSRSCLPWLQRRSGPALTSHDHARRPSSTATRCQRRRAPQSLPTSATLAPPHPTPAHPPLGSSLVSGARLIRRWPSHDGPLAAVHVVDPSSAASPPPLTAALPPHRRCTQLPHMQSLPRPMNQATAMGQGRPVEGHLRG
jgi:hypothetical protein